MITKKALIGALRLIAAGGFLWVVDLHVNGFDVFNDSIGIFLIVTGLIILLRIKGPPQYRRRIKFVFLSALFISVVTVTGRFHIFKGYDYIFLASGIITIVAVHNFASSFMALLQRYGLNRTKNIWRKVSSLFLFIYEIPFGIFCIGGLFSIFKGHGLYLSINGFWAVPVVVILCVPLAYIIRATLILEQET